MARDEQGKTELTMATGRDEAVSKKHQSLDRPLSLGINRGRDRVVGDWRRSVGWGEGKRASGCRRG